MDSLPRPVDSWLLFDSRFDETATLLGRGATTLLLDTVETSISLHCVTPVGSEIKVDSSKCMNKCLVW